ncbi:hypothetical protein ISS04_04150 [Candidatus Woesearchaeota archaeon]|nr:hypothetical protein [Candidatus Woesearchaeota archaeon]
MGLELILSDAKIKKKTLNLSFRDKNNGENYSDVYFAWNHAFVVWPRIKSNKRDDQGVIDGYLNRLEKHLNEHEVFGNYKLKKFTRAFPLLQVKVPITKKERLIDELAVVGINTEERNIIKGVEIPSHYLDYVRWSFGELGDIVEVDERVISALKEKKGIENKIYEMYKGIDGLLSDKSSGQITRHKNKLHKIFERYDGTNYDELKKELSGNIFTNRVGNFWGVRKEISDSVFELDKKLKEVGDNCKIRFYDRNEKLKNNSNNYGLDMYFDSNELVKFSRKMSADDWRNQKWLFLDIEKPRFDSPDEEVSWVSFVYYCGKVLKKETHTLRGVGVEEVDGYKIFEYDSVDELVLGLNSSVNGENPFVVSAYKASFDLPELREASSQKFSVGVGDEHPRYVVSVPFFERMGLRGRVVFDMFSLARLMNQNLPNRKLELVSKHVLGDSAFGKSINYEQQRELEEIAIDGVVESRRDDVLGMIEEHAGKKVFEMGVNELKRHAAQKIAEYVGGDTDILPKLLFESDWGKNGLESLCLFSDIFGTGIERLTTFNAINDLQKRLYFENVGIFEDFVYTRWKDVIKQEQSAIQYFKNIKNKMIVGGKNKGLHKDVCQVYIPPSLDSLELLGIRKEVKDEMDKFPTTAENIQQKYFFGNMLSSLMREFNIDYAIYDKKRKALEDSKHLLLITDKDFKDIYRGLRWTMGQNSDWALRHLEKGTIRFKTFEKYVNMDGKAALFVANKGVEMEDFFDAVKRRASGRKPKKVVEFNKAYSRFTGKHVCSPETFWSKVEDHYQNVNKFLVDNGLEVVHKSGNYFYVIGEVENLKKDDSPIIPIDNLDAVYVADHIYYKEHGYYKGISVKDGPSDNLSVYEMRLFKGFIDNVLNEGGSKAMEEFKVGLCELNEGLPVKEMIYYTKSSDTYSAFVDGEKKKFNSVDEIISAGVDFEMYKNKVLRKAEILIKPLVGIKGAKEVLYKSDQLSLF